MSSGEIGLWDAPTLEDKKLMAFPGSSIRKQSAYYLLLNTASGASNRIWRLDSSGRRERECSNGS